MYYIEEADKPNLIEKKFNIVKLEGNKIIIPIDTKKEDKNVEIKNKEKNKEIRKETIISKKIEKILKKANSTKIILSKEVKKKKIIENKLYTLGYDIVDGKWIMKMLIPEIIEKIIEKEEITKNELDIYILINDARDEIIENIKILVEKYRNIYIITNHKERFKKLEEKTFKNIGAPITIMNNKKRSLLKAKIIINVDYPNELINQYNINQQSIILDLYGETKINKKSYNGKIIKEVEINKKRNEIFNINEKLYSQIELYEALFYKKQPFKNVREKIKKDKVIVRKIK